MILNPPPPCPHCGKFMVREPPHLGGLVCEACGMGYTYSYAVRLGYVAEMAPGDREKAIAAYRARMEAGFR
jgi:transposase-like protein